VLAESVSTYAPNTTAYSDSLASLGLAGQSVTAQLNEIVTQQAYMMATNDFFRISCAAFLVLAVLVWITKPRQGAAASAGH
jgi:DHA2 family multidrug resistance protein